MQCYRIPYPSDKRVSVTSTSLLAFVVQGQFDRVSPPTSCCMYFRAIRRYAHRAMVCGSPGCMIALYHNLACHRVCEVVVRRIAVLTPCIGSYMPDY